jgi:hypothetical protein
MGQKLKYPTVHFNSKISHLDTVVHLHKMEIRINIFIEIRKCQRVEIVLFTEKVCNKSTILDIKKN